MKPSAPIATRWIAVFVSMLVCVIVALTACASRHAAPTAPASTMQLAINIVGQGNVNVAGASGDAFCLPAVRVDPSYNCVYQKTEGKVDLVAQEVGSNKFLQWESGGVVLGTSPFLTVQVTTADLGKTKIITAVFGPIGGDAGPDGDTSTPPTDSGDASAATATLVDSASRFPPITLSGWKCAMDPSYGWVLQYTLGPDFGAAVGIDAGTGTFVVFVSIDGAQIRRVSGVLNDILWQSSTPISLTTDTSGNLPSTVMTASPGYTGTMTLSGHYDCK